MRKYSAKNFRKAILVLEKLLMVAFLVLAYMFTLFECYPEVVFFYKGNYIVALAYLLTLLAFFSAYGCFRVGVLRLKELLFSFLLALLITNAISYLTLALIARHVLSFLPIAVMTGVQYLVEMLFYIIANKTYFLLNPARDTVVICAGTRRDEEVIQKFEAISDRYNVGLILYEADSVENIKVGILSFNTVVLCEVSNALREELIKFCFEHDKRLFIMPTVQDITLNSAEATQIADSLAFLCKNRTLTLEQYLLKRALDLCFSTLALLLTAPIMLAVALLIKLWDGGPVFYNQVRLTRNNEPFMLFKFRSMVEDAEKDGAQMAVKGDRRITPIGRFIRAARIDELPQLLNVFKGDISLVGPRAERPEFIEEYCRTCPDFKYRTKVKAGLTGYAQVYGKYNTSFEDKLRMDLYYIENYSLLLDLKLLFSTVKVVFMKESAEGFQEKKKAKKH